MGNIELFKRQAELLRERHQQLAETTTELEEVGLELIKGSPDLFFEIAPEIVALKHARLDEKKINYLMTKFGIKFITTASGFVGAYKGYVIIFGG